MDLFRGAERLMSMDEAAWQRHASPWSVWTRILTPLPLLSVAVWSRVWLGWWCLLPVALAGLWIWWNPRAFRAPAHTDSWASKGTFGERIFLARRHDLVPRHHVRAAHALTLLSAVGAPVWIYGLVALDPWAVVAGVLAISLPKVWFVDRMVWVYEDLKDHDPEWSGWLR